MRHFFITCILLLISPSGLAATADIFVPTEGDLSVYYLGQIFGTVSQITTPQVASSVTIIGNMFGIFNQVAITVGIILVIYAIIIGVANSAGTGKFLGEKWSSLWLPVRMTAGVALLLPKANGYCLAQVIVMWITIQGIGAADTLWAQALDYIDHGSEFYVGDQGVDERQQELEDAYDNFSRVFKYVSCLQANDNDFAAGRGIVNYEYGTYVDPKRQSDPSLIFGPRNDEGTLVPECGSVDDIPPDYTDAYLSLVSDLLASGLPDKVASNAFASNKVPYTETEKNNMGLILASFVNNIKANTPPPGGGGLQNIDVDKVKDYGWILAGAYYKVFTNANPTIKYDIDYTSAKTDPSDAMQAIYKNVLDEADAFTEDASSDILQSGAVEENVAASILANISDVGDQGHDFPKWLKALQIDKAFKAMSRPVFNAIDSIGAQGNKDPFSQAIEIGEDMMKAAAAILGILIAANVVLGLATKICDGQQPVGLMLTPVQDMLNIVGIGVGSIMYVQGASLAMYLPMIPFIIFFITSLGWMISVFEAMIAAPLVAIGLAWPEAQNEVLGKADPAVMLFLSLFLRPALMIIGLICSLLLVWVGFTFFSIGFRYMLGSDFIGYEPMFGWVAIGLVYIMLLITVAQKCFTLIHHVPDKVLSWIGDRTQALGPADTALQQLRGGVQTGVELGYSAGTQTAKAGGVVGGMAGSAYVIARGKKKT